MVTDVCVHTDTCVNDCYCDIDVNCYRPQTKCLSFCPRGEYLGRYPPGRYTPLDRYTPQAGTAP